MLFGYLFVSIDTHFSYHMKHAISARLPNPTCFYNHLFIRIYLIQYQSEDFFVHEVVIEVFSQ